MAPFRTLWSLLKLSQALLLLEFLAWLFIALEAPPLVVSFYFSLAVCLQIDSSILSPFWFAVSLGTKTHTSLEFT